MSKRTRGVAPSGRQPYIDKLPFGKSVPVVYNLYCLTISLAVKPDDITLNVRLLKNSSAGSYVILREKLLRVISILKDGNAFVRVFLQ